MKTADEFLAKKHLFQLGDLPTESPHPGTQHLSELAQSDPHSALRILRDIDLHALRKAFALKSEMRPIFAAVGDALASGSKIYLAGCGATGRLSLSLEYLWRRRWPDSNQVVSLMAGGDVALVHSLEGFEDYPEYGARHLRELGFGPNDLLIGSSEGGETPYVIGAVEEAARVSRRPPVFLFCNPPDLLCARVERSRRVITHPGVLARALETGPMALTGSTRMQASTVLMLMIGLALEHRNEVDQAFAELEEWIRFLESSPVAAMKEFVIREAEAYRQGARTLYSAGDAAITAFTDTTERAPTFNLAPFDNPHHLTDRHSLTYVTIPCAASADQAWRMLLARAPRPLEWPEVHPKATAEYLRSFDFGRGAAVFRRALLPDSEHHVFAIECAPERLSFSFRGLEEHFALLDSSELFDHLTLKILLNMHSTLVMGRLGRFEGNLMTWVYPSNGKLVDRAARYTQTLLRRRGFADFTYDQIVRAQFKAKSDLQPAESIVHKTIAILLSRERPLERH